MQHLRLDQFVAKALGKSRKAAKQLIQQGCISVDGLIVKDGKLKISLQQQVGYQDNMLALKQSVYLALYKPAGYCCSHVDDNAPSALRLISEEFKQQKLFFAGRLDTDTSGLVLLSSDGQWCHRVSKPQKQNFDNDYSGKRYRVGLAKAINQSSIDALEQGVMLRSENKLTLPCQIQQLSAHEVIIELHEGRYHQVRRMFAYCNNRVISLHRESIGTIKLGSLQSGQFRQLSNDEIQSFIG